MDWKLNRVITLLLSLWIGLSPALMSAPAASMTLQMAQASDTTSSDCGCCPGAKPSRTICSLMCAGVPPLAAVQCIGLIPPAGDDELQPEPDAVLTSRIAAPDLPPPRRHAFS
ncbi:MAG: hypothetical protein E6Q97_26240 [Desulfurellales bacterium]|jgi:hypothetical protein|nr:MAG: hypothetical protein E6Q97_26240 [Desulfurellales bacterium]